MTTGMWAVSIVVAIAVMAIVVGKVLERVSERQERELRDDEDPT